MAPGVRDSVKMRIGSDGQEYLQTSHYDQYGRLIARTDHTSHPSLRPIHPDPHHHQFNYGPGNNEGRGKIQMTEVIFSQEFIGDCKSRFIFFLHLLWIE